MVYLCTKQKPIYTTMKHKYSIALLILVATLVVLPSKLSAQTYEFRDSTGIYRVEYIANKEVSKPAHAWRNDIRVGIGMPGALSILSLNGVTTGEIVETIFDTRASNYYYSSYIYIPPLTLEYSGYVKDWLLIGGKASFSAEYRYKYDKLTDERVGIDTSGSFVAGGFFTMRFEYMRREVVRLYSGFGVGMTVHTCDRVQTVTPFVDMTYFGVSVGKSIYGFAEVGGGTSGCLRFGMGAKF